MNPVNRIATILAIALAPITLALISPIVAIIAMPLLTPFSVRLAVLAPFIDFVVAPKPLGRCNDEMLDDRHSTQSRKDSFATAPWAHSLYDDPIVIDRVRDQLMKWSIGEPS